MRNKVLELIDAIRDSYIHAETVYTRGGCYQFYLILKAVFPQAEPMYSQIEGHVLTEIDGRYYDIKGEVKVIPNDLFHLDEEPRIHEEAKGWYFDWGLI